MPITLSDDQVEKLEAALDRLDNLTTALVNMPGLPDRIHIMALRDALPSVARDLRSAAGMS